MVIPWQEGVLKYTLSSPYLAELDHTLDSESFGGGTIIRQAIWNVFGTVWMHQVVPYSELPL